MTNPSTDYNGLEWLVETGVLESDDYGLADPTEEHLTPWNIYSQSSQYFDDHGIHSKATMDAYLNVQLLNITLILIPILIIVTWLVWMRVREDIAEWYNLVTEQITPTAIVAKSTSMQISRSISLQSTMMDSGLCHSSSNLKPLEEHVIDENESVATRPMSSSDELTDAIDPPGDTGNSNLTLESTNSIQLLFCPESDATTNGAL
eukprot:GHVH01008441.1.p1 GENE.GHVH01008441.1~~GHVH01008441.1.p1  ORF type:complete len:205 (-),score=33.86 GHVH01008441.1:323-937(-)